MLGTASTTRFSGRLRREPLLHKRWLVLSRLRLTKLPLGEVQSARVIRHLRPIKRRIRRGGKMK